MNMKKGDVLQIDGSWGFLWSPKIRILEIKRDLCLTEPVDSKDGGLLSHLNKTYCGLSMLESRMEKQK